MSDQRDGQKMASEIAPLREEISETPDRDVLNEDPEVLRQYLELMHNLQVVRTP